MVDSNSLLSRLPDELQLAMMAHLPPQSIMTLARVSRKYFNLAFDRKVWQTYCVEVSQQDGNASYLKRQQEFANYGNVKEEYQSCHPSHEMIQTLQTPLDLLKFVEDWLDRAMGLQSVENIKQEIAVILRDLKTFIESRHDQEDTLEDLRCFMGSSESGKELMNQINSTLKGCLDHAISDEILDEIDLLKELFNKLKAAYLENIISYLSCDATLHHSYIKAIVLLPAWHSLLIKYSNNWLHKLITSDGLLPSLNHDAIILNMMRLAEFREEITNRVYLLYEIIKNCPAVIELILTEQSLNDLKQALCSHEALVHKCAERHLNIAKLFLKNREFMKLYSFVNLDGLVRAHPHALQLIRRPAGKNNLRENRTQHYALYLIDDEQYQAQSQFQALEQQDKQAMQFLKRYNCNNFGAFVRLCAVYQGRFVMKYPDDYLSDLARYVDVFYTSLDVAIRCLESLRSPVAQALVIEGRLSLGEVLRMTPEALSICTDKQRSKDLLQAVPLKNLF